jgi:hypothetical protein
MCPGRWRLGLALVEASAHTVSMVYEDVSGGLVIGKWHRTLRWAVDELVDKLRPERLRKLNIRAGEHLAAILTTAFLGTAPADVDATGGVDLWFDLPDPRESCTVDIVPAHMTNAAFEVKSLPGDFRKFDSRIDRDKARALIQSAVIYVPWSERQRMSCTILFRCCLTRGISSTVRPAVVAYR